jgi:hypothetical protein
VQIAHGRYENNAGATLEHSAQVVYASMNLHEINPRRCVLVPDSCHP